MNLKTRPEIPRIVELELVQPSPINCNKCGSNEHEKIDFTKTGNQRYCCKKCQTKFVQLSPNSKFIRSDDVWWAEDLSLPIHPHRKNHGSKFNFQPIEQLWLKEIIKKFIKYRSNTGIGFDMMKRDLIGLKDFSLFLLLNPHVDCIEAIDRSVIIQYLEYNHHKKMSAQAKNGRISILASLFETGIINNWFFTEPHLIRREDYHKSDNKPLPRYIPDDVIRQLNHHLDSLHEPVMRMVLVTQECGLRIGELCQLPLDCLNQDSKGGWFIQFMRWKLKFETTLPISIELAQVIKEQQKYIKRHLGKKYQYLFCANQGHGGKFIPISKVMEGRAFISYIKRLADKFDICDSTGNRWNFQTHQFRHTVGTGMINNGVPQHIVQRFLGHDSPDMTSVYAHIHDTTLRKEIDKYLDLKVVNINGEVIQSLSLDLDTDAQLQWMKKNILAESLSNGYCGLPIQLTCTKGNACLTCGDFCTTIEFLDQHKQQLERTNQVLAVAQTNNWERQLQVNQDVKTSLEKIIATLEADLNV
jgi:integrase/recombinase XerD